MTAVDWIAADWGTSNLRVWGMSESGTVISQASSDKGMSKLDRSGFEPALLELVGDWITGPTTVIACGMVGARQGWAEAPYQRTPCAPLSDRFGKPQNTDPRLDVHIIPGVAQADPADVMRGEETQIAGFLSLNPNWDGVICLPGTHTKWAHVSADEIVSFQTAMTGDLFAAITGHTVLRHSVQSDDWDDANFEDGLDSALARPEKLAARLFHIRADGLLNDLAPGAARARLSGLLIGAELAATKPYWLGQQIAVIGEGALSRLYVSALAKQAVQATAVQGDRITLAGLTTAYRTMKETT